MSRDGATPSQTVGPFFRLGMDRPEWSDLTREGARGEKIAIEGQVLDGDGAPVDDAVLEIWQADAEGRYDHPDDGRPADPRFHGFGRAMTDEAGRYRFVTIRPGRVPGRGGAPPGAPPKIPPLPPGVVQQTVNPDHLSGAGAPHPPPPLRAGPGAAPRPPPAPRP